MSAAIQMRALTLVDLGDGRKALPGQVFTTNLENAARLLRDGEAVVLDERDIARIAGRESELRRVSSRRMRGRFGAREH